jgi:hypothetical protein
MYFDGKLNAYLMRYFLLLVISLFINLIHSQIPRCELDSSLTWEQWLPHAGRWGVLTRRKVSYQSPGNIAKTSVLIRSGNHPIGGAEAQFQRQYRYDQSGTITAVIHERLDSEGGAWEAYHREVFESIDGLTKLRRTEAWSEDQQAWEETGRQVNHFDQAGHLVSEAHYQTKAGMPPQPTYQTTTRYEGELQVEVVNWQGQGPHWQPQTRTSKRYDVQQRLLMEKSDQWQVEGQQWQPERKLQYQYQTNAPEVVQQVWQWQANQWQLRGLRQQVDDSLGRLLSLRHERWDANGDPQPVQTWSYEYETSHWTEQVWITETAHELDAADRPKPISRVSREYQGDEDLVSVIHWQWDQPRQAWQLAYRMQGLHGEPREGVRMDAWETFQWDNQTETWLPLTRSENYSRCSAPEASWQPLVFPNPAQRHLSLSTHAWGKGLCTVALYTLTGQQVRYYQGETPHEALSINISSLPAGVYWLHVSTGERRGGTKVWVK